MNCPLKFSNLTNRPDINCECEEELCAWWVIPESTTKAGRCAIRELAEKTFDVKVLDSMIKGL